MNSEKACFNTFDTGPSDIVCDKNGDFYIADTWNYAIHKFSHSGKLIKTTKKAEYNNIKQDMFGPRGIAINSRGLVYVTDTGNKYIRVFDSNLEPLSSFGGEGRLPGRFDEPVGIAIDSSDNIYVADTGNNRIQKFNSEGKYLEEYPTRKHLQKDFYSMQPYLEVFSDGRIIWTASSYGEFWILNIVSKKYSVFKIDEE